MVRSRRHVLSKNRSAALTSVFFLSFFLYFVLLGTVVAAKQIEELIKSLNIQVDNMCNFLPQDKVVEFTRLDPIQRLKETQKAAGRDDLVEIQATLKSMYDQQEKKKKEVETLDEKRETLEKLNERVEADVSRIREKERIEKAMMALNVKVLHMRADEEDAKTKGLKGQWDQSKRALKEAHASVKEKQRPSTRRKGRRTKPRSPN